MNAKINIKTITSKTTVKMVKTKRNLEKSKKKGIKCKPHTKFLEPPPLSAPVPDGQAPTPQAGDSRVLCEDMGPVWNVLNPGIEDPSATANPSKGSRIDTFCSLVLIPMLLLGSHL